MSAWNSQLTLSCHCLYWVVLPTTSGINQLAHFSISSFLSIVVWMSINGQHASARCLRDRKIASTLPFPSEITVGVNNPSAACLRHSNLTELLSGREHHFTPEWNTNWFWEACRTSRSHFTVGADSVDLKRFQKTVRVKSIPNASPCLAMVPSQWWLSYVDFGPTNLATCVCLGHGDV